MNDTPTSNPPMRRSLSPALLAGAALLIASLGAVGGWMMHAARLAQPLPAQLTLAANEQLVAPGPADVGPASPALLTSPPALVTPPAAAASPQRTAPATPPTEPAATPARTADRAPASTARRKEAVDRAERQTPRRSTAVAQAPRERVSSSGTERARPPLQRVATCLDCATVVDVRTVTRRPEGPGVGAVAGTVIGGLLGHQVGGGNGRKVATVVGAVGGGIAGHEIEKRMRSETLYEVQVRMDNGERRTITQRDPVQPGARVRVDGDTLRAASARDSGDHRA